jgi:hypothetical protein
VAQQSPTRCPIIFPACPLTRPPATANGPVSANVAISHPVLPHLNRALCQTTRTGTTTRCLTCWITDSLGRTDTSWQHGHDAEASPAAVTCQVHDPSSSHPTSKISNPGSPNDAANEIPWSTYACRHPMNVLFAENDHRMRQAYVVPSRQPAVITERHPHQTLTATGRLQTQANCEEPDYLRVTDRDGHTRIVLRIRVEGVESLVAMQIMVYFGICASQLIRHKATNIVVGHS